MSTGKAVVAASNIGRSLHRIPATRLVSAWLPDGKTLLMPAGTKVWSWTRGGAGWTEVFDAASHKLGTVSRLAVSPKGDVVAIVVAEPKP